MLLPLRRHLSVIGQYLGDKKLVNEYGETLIIPQLKVVAAALANGYFYIDQDWTTVASDVEFYFDDRLLAKIEKRLKPLEGETAASDTSAQETSAASEVAALPGVGPKPTAPRKPLSPECARLKRILASEDDVVALHGPSRAQEIMQTSKEKYQKHHCEE